MTDLLSRDICLRCCKKALSQKMDADWFEKMWQDYKRVFRREWKEGFGWCEKEGKWLDFFNDDKSEFRLIMTGAARDAFIAKCPYLLEHTVSGVKHG